MFKLGHVLIKVFDLEEAVRDFEGLGFTVTMGSLPGKAKNALIYLSDGTFIELYDTSAGKLDFAILRLLKVMAKFKPDKANRYLNYVTSDEGINDFAFDSVLEKEYHMNLKSLEENGLNLLEPTKKQRVDVTGCKRKWTLCFPKDWRMPFFMGPYEPKVILDNKQSFHENEVIGIHSLTIEVPEYNYFIETYKMMTESFEVSEDESIFYFGSSFIKLKRSDIYKIHSICLIGREKRSLSKELSHHASIEIIAEEKE